MNIPINDTTAVNRNIDLVVDISKKDAEKYGLIVIPYFFDSVAGERQHLDYFYFGVRNAQF